MTDLATCDSEPIHIPGSIQPHGVLMTLDSEGARVLQVAGDTEAMFGRDNRAMLGQSLADLIGPEAEPLQDLGKLAPEPQFVAMIAHPRRSGEFVDIIAHVVTGVVVLEFEPRRSSPAQATGILADVRRVAFELSAADDIQDVLDLAVRHTRRITGYDRAMIYRFLEDGAGAVAAEDKAPDLPAFLHHHYPASDIPSQARALYLANPIRVIPDVAYRPAPLVPPINPNSGAPLDMSDCALRSVSPIHIQYLKNMGVGASLSISIIVDGALWGLVACHHRSPRAAHYEVRELCKHLGQMLGQQLHSREEAQRHRKTLDLAARRASWVARTAAANSVEQSLVEDPDGLLKIIPSQGAAIVTPARITQTGLTPSDEQTRAIWTWLSATASQAPFATSSLVKLRPEAQSFAGAASGVLAVNVPGPDPLTLIWFRPERVQTIKWAGDPSEAVKVAPTQGQLSPRQSFEVWKETVRNQAQPWTVEEIDAAAQFGHAVRELRSAEALRKLNSELRRVLADKDTLLDQKELLMKEIHHRVQNSLQLVHSMLRLQARNLENDDARRQLDVAAQRIMAVGAVHRQLWKSDLVQQVNFGAHLTQLRDDLVESWGEAWRDRIRIKAGQVLLPTDRAIILALVTTEILTNAVKYAYGGAPGPIDISVREEVGRGLRLTIADRGGGMPTTPNRQGLGTRLIQTLTTQIGGRVETTTGAGGTSVVLTVPFEGDNRGDA